MRYRIESSERGEVDRISVADDIETAREIFKRVADQEVNLITTVYELDYGLKSWDPPPYFVNYEDMIYKGDNGIRIYAVEEPDPPLRFLGIEPVSDEEFGNWWIYALCAISIVWFFSIILN